MQELLETTKQFIVLPPLNDTIVSNRGKLWPSLPVTKLGFDIRDKSSAQAQFTEKEVPLLKELHKTVRPILDSIVELIYDVKNETRPIEDRGRKFHGVFITQDEDCGGKALLDQVVVAALDRDVTVIDGNDVGTRTNNEQNCEAYPALLRMIQSKPLVVIVNTGDGGSMSHPVGVPLWISILEGETKDLFDRVVFVVLVTGEIENKSVIGYPGRIDIQKHLPKLPAKSFDDLLTPVKIELLGEKPRSLSQVMTLSGRTYESIKADYDAKEARKAKKAAKKAKKAAEKGA